jgi:hypothetical protein
LPDWRVHRNDLKNKSAKTLNYGGKCSEIGGHCQSVTRFVFPYTGSKEPLVIVCEGFLYIQHKKDNAINKILFA